MFCHVSACRACSGARSGMTPSLRAGAPGIPPCSGTCLSSDCTGPSFQSGSTPAAGPRRVPFPRVSRAPLRGRAGASCAGAVRAPDCARETADARLPSAPAGVFCGPSRSPAQKSRKAAPGAAFYSHSTTLFPQSSPRRTVQSPGPGIIPCALTAPGFRLMSGTRRRGGRVSYPSDCKSAYTGSIPVRASRRPKRAIYRLTGLPSPLVLIRSAVNRLVVLHHCPGWRANFTCASRALAKPM